MEDNNKETASAPPIVTRLDRLDLLLQFLEERHCSLSRTNKSVGSLTKVKDNEDLGFECNSTRSVTSALQEVHQKGTLLERLESLEKRVLQMSQLSLEMEAISRSRSSHTVDHEKLPVPETESVTAAAASTTIIEAQSKGLAFNNCAKTHKTRKWSCCFRFGFNTNQ